MALASVPELRTVRLLLRPVAEDEAPALPAAFGDPHSMRFWDAPPSPDIAETTRRINQSVVADPEFHTADTVVARDTGIPIGMVNYHARHPTHGRLALGWIIMPAMRRRGYASEATCILLRHCFTTLAANRIEARIEPDNLASQRMAEGLGFQREALMREWALAGGSPRDMALYALLRSGWSG
ncbi:MAG: GNAT family N-acetyltransferase [Rhodopila sp.]